MASNDLQGYKIQGIYYLNKRTHRIQQNVGGACPLLALCNTLFLNHQIHYNKGGRRIKFGELTDCLTQHLENMLNSDTKNGGIVKTELKVDKKKDDKSNNNGEYTWTTTDDDDIDNNNPTKKSIFEDDSHGEEIDDNIDSDNPPPLISAEDDPQPTQSTHSRPTQCAQSQSQPQSQQQSKQNSAVNEEKKDKESAPLTPKNEDIDSKENVNPSQTKSDRNVEDGELKESEKDTDDKDKEKAMEDRTEEEKAMDDKLKRIEECVKLFPKLEEGLDINIKFSDACDFEENPGYRMFSHYGFKLFHGWVIDPKQEKLYELIGEKSYDETIDFLISDPKKDATEEEIKALEDDKEVVRKFFAESATQLTSYGLERLYTLMDIEDELSIFFRNNHFSTIVKHQGILYEFVTDEGIVDADPQITWQTLLQISGDEQFVNNKFQEIHNNISQMTQIQQYNRLKFQTENGLLGDDGNGGTGGNGVSINVDDDEKKIDYRYPPDSLIGILNNALDFIDSKQFKKLVEEEEDIDPLVSHGLTQRTTDTFDRWICKDILYGMPLSNNDLSLKNLEFTVRSFEMSDAKNILDLMTIGHLKEDQHYKNIDFMHHDHKYALILEIVDPNDNSGDINKSKQDQQQIEENKQMEEEKQEQEEINNPIIGCIQYEWMKFNFYDWRESDWEDYDYDIYNMSSNTNGYERRRLLRESGVRVDYFVRIIDMCIAPRYQSKGLGAQLLQSLIYAFPSSSKFGIEVNAENIGATKCITKCGFKIARIEQQYGMRYKMVIESSYTFSQYQSWLYNSQLTFPKVISTQNLHKDKDKASSSHNNRTQRDISHQHQHQQQQQQGNDDEHLGSYPVTPDRQKQRNRNNRDRDSHRRDRGRTARDHDNVVIKVHDGDDEEDEDEDIDPNYGDPRVQSQSHNVHNPVIQRGQRQGQGQAQGPRQGSASSNVNNQASRGRNINTAATDEEDPDHAHGTSSDYEDDSDDDLHGAQVVQQFLHMAEQGGQGGHGMPIGQVGNVHHGGGQGGGGVGAMDFGQVGGLLSFGDDVIMSTLMSLELDQYIHTFNEFQINEQALMHLDPSVVEFMINDENDRNKFLAWLHQYQNKDAGGGSGSGSGGDQQHAQQTSAQQQQAQPSKAPQQQSTDVETGHGHQGYPHDHMDEDDHGDDADTDENHLGSGSYQ